MPPEPNEGNVSRSPFSPTRNDFFAEYFHDKWMESSVARGLVPCASGAMDGDNTNSSADVVPGVPRRRGRAPATADSRQRRARPRLLVMPDSRRRTRLPTFSMSKWRLVHERSLTLCSDMSMRNHDLRALPVESATSIPTEMVRYVVDR
jgi:hypothetical protein